jgi:murein DD-endopeptidase MepM/ murein hydrolase activator NlpD
MASKKKSYTFLVVAPHGKLWKIRLPAYAARLAAVGGLVALVSVAALANSYARMLLKVANYNHVRSQQAALQNQYQALQNTVTTTNAKLDSLESLASEVALAYGFGGTETRLGLPSAVLALATRNNATLEASYNASLYAFNLMKTTALRPPTAPLTRAFVGTIPDGADIPSMWPVRGQITGGFGERMDPLSGEGAFHAGIDISAPIGTPVEATGDGVVVAANREAGYGNEILVDHGDGIATKYCHLRQIYVLVGQEVKRGQVIGVVGMTGRSTGPHLHYEVLVNQAPVNPAKYLGG